MTWVAVVKFWAYQAHQLRIIVYAKTMRTIHGLELFSSANRQWGKYSLSDAGGGWVTFPIRFSNSQYVLNVTHYNMLSERVDIYLEIAYLDTQQCYIRSSRDSTEVHVIAIRY